ncbi:hypothetical protein EMIHUDRAFT_249907 [Emiliania huxleyi CCMP1516]|uniref:Uncharacterized protein n=2 Tax=Emiliania huxleyi TaxID=2903 RepID=A0A0D3I4Y2_EMIH1|nr:hypothetical protein EMIHUDRAFT_249907 [Emiliania huxleyi CCMP1516]EOD06317.1 hypothetical protein EMIHUDRAFT_249907 [Emiliania huxleyi CCMP1516]|eukprot:XP_005758746.1 hypothetical protein EMIHUDRAFT_249907 [Emiliania huxleyi CCMP1516]
MRVLHEREVQRLQLEIRRLQSSDERQTESDMRSLSPVEPPPPAPAPASRSASDGLDPMGERGGSFGATRAPRMCPDVAAFSELPPPERLVYAITGTAARTGGSLGVAASLTASQAPFVAALRRKDKRNAALW